MFFKDYDIVYHKNYYKTLQNDETIFLEFNATYNLKVKKFY